MKKRWVKRKMNKALTMITLASTVALMSPMLVQTGTIAYAVAQDQPTVLVDTEAGKLDYTYQMDDTNIYWSLSVNEKEAADSAYLRLKIDSVDSINVAGQSIGKDESGWFVLDAATGSAKSYQVGFVTANNGSQELPIAAELVTPGEEGAEDQVQSLITNGTLKAEIPVVTELPEVETDPTESLEDPVAGENGEAGAETVVGEEAEEAPPADNELDVDAEDASLGENTGNDAAVAEVGVVEVTPFGVSANTHKSAAIAGGTDISVGERENIGEKYAEAGQKVTFTSSFTLAYNSNHQNYQWSAKLNSNTMAFTTNQKIAVEYLSENGWKSLDDATVDSSGNLSKLSLPSQPTNSNKSVAYTVRITVSTKTDLEGNNKGTFASSVSYEEYVKVPSRPERWEWRNATPDTKSTYYWVRGNVLRLRNEVATGEKDLVTTATSIVEGITPYANPGDEVSLTSKFTLPSDADAKQYRNFKWTATLDLQTLDVAVEDTVGIWLYQGNNTPTYYKDVKIKAGGVIEPAFTLNSRGEYTCKIVTTSNRNLKIKNAGITSDLQGVFTSKITYQTRTRSWSWSNWSNADPVSKKSNYLVKGNPVPIDNPTYLSWEEGKSVINRVDGKTYDIANLSEGYSGSFYWTDEDGIDGINFALMRDTDRSVIFTKDETNPNKVNFVIPFDLFDYGENQFTIEAFNSEGDVVSEQALALVVTTEGYVKLVSVPESLSWTGRTIDETAVEGAVLSRDSAENQKMTIAVRDSREQGRHTWKLTVSTIEAVDAQLYNLIWRGDNTDTVLSSTNSKILTVDDIPSVNGTWDCSQEYSVSEGILLKPKQAMPAGDHSVIAGVKWSLNNVGTTE